MGSAESRTPDYCQLGAPQDGILDDLVVSDEDEVGYNIEV